MIFPRVLRAVAVMMALCSGAFLALQSALNGALKVPLNSGLMAAFFSILGAFTSLLLLFPFSLGQKPRDKGPNPLPVRWWMWFVGGSVSCYYVTAGTFLGPKIGYGLFYAAAITGQLITGLVLDHIAFMGVPRAPATAWRIGSMAVVLAGAIMAIADKVNVDNVSTGALVGYVFVCVAGGALLTLQAPINSAFTLRIGTLAHRTSLIAFSVSLCFISTIWGISVGIKGNGLSDVHLDEASWWMFFGGPLGAFYMFASVLLAPFLGVAWFFVAVIAGQLLMSLLIDSFGIAKSSVIDPSAMRIAGVVLVFFGGACFRLLPLDLATQNIIRKKLGLPVREIPETPETIDPELPDDDPSTNSSKIFNPAEVESYEEKHEIIEGQQGHLIAKV